MKNIKQIFYICIFLNQILTQISDINIDLYQTSTSGISSGGYMSVQLHIAFSDIMVGSGIVAGGPYFCAESQLTIATTWCMEYPSYINLKQLMNLILKANKKGQIDTLENMRHQKVYIYSGTKDNVVKPGVTKKLEEQYQQLGVLDIKTEYNIPSQHAWITDDFGNECDYKGSPFMNNCDYDSAQALLSQIYGDLNEKVEQVPDNLIQFSQKGYRKYGDSLNSVGYVYIPTSCQNGEECKIHVSFHGCEQTLNDIGLDFVQRTGLNEVAESNNIVVLYPQVEKSLLNPLNPKGCWDFWGYTQNEILEYGSMRYATKKGDQPKAIYKMIEDLANGELKIQNQQILE